MSVDAVSALERGVRRAPHNSTLDLLDEKRNVVFIGTTGVGKTHLLTAIGVTACTNGYRVLFTTAAELLMSLIASKRNDRLDVRRKAIERYHFLIIDELGYIPFEREATDLLFQVISSRYGRGSIGITTNLAFRTGRKSSQTQWRQAQCRSTRSPRRDFRAQRQEPPTTIAQEGRSETKPVLNGVGGQILDAERGQF